MWDELFIMNPVCDYFNWKVLLIVIIKKMIYVFDTTIKTNWMKYVNCCTRKNKTSDKCYGNVTSAFSASTLPPLGQSDHNVNLQPKYQRLCGKHLIPQIWIHKLIWFQTMYIFVWSQFYPRKIISHGYQRNSYIY